MFTKGLARKKNRTWSGQKDKKSQFFLGEGEGKDELLQARALDRRLQLEIKGWELWKSSRTLYRGMDCWPGTEFEDVCCSAAPRYIESGWLSLSAPL